MVTALSLTWSLYARVSERERERERERGGVGEMGGGVGGGGGGGGGTACALECTCVQLTTICNTPCIMLFKSLVPRRLL